MIDLEFLQSLIRTLDESGLDSLELERGGTKIRLSKSPEQVVTSGGAVAAPVMAATPSAVVSASAPESEAPALVDTPPVSSNLVEITSPMVGTFFRAPGPDAPAYVEVGGRVGPGDTLCIIEAMKLMNELPSEVKGTVAEVCVDNGEPVEYGQVLFRLTPDA